MPSTSHIVSCQQTPGLVFFETCYEADWSGSLIIGDGQAYAQQRENNSNVQFEPQNTYVPGIVLVKDQ
jgi:hypothetical protein